MNFVYCFFFLTFSAKRLDGALAEGQDVMAPCTINNDVDKKAVSNLNTIRDRAEEMAVSIDYISNDTKLVAEMTINERAELTELLHHQYQDLMALLNQIPMDKNPQQIKDAFRMIRDKEKPTEKAIMDTIRRLRSIETETDEKDNQHYYTGQETNHQGFHDSNSDDNNDSSSWHKNNQYHRRQEREQFKSGKYQKMRGSHHRERFLNLNEAIRNGDHRTVNSHIFGDRFHGGSSSNSWSHHSGGTPEGRRLAREARRLSTKKDRCNHLAKCAKRMKKYDYFVYLFSDDIDGATGMVDDNVKVLYDENISEKEKKVKELTKAVEGGGEDFNQNCDELLSMFHRTIEHGDVPQWEGATISQVCLAEGTTTYVDLGSAAKTALPKLELNLCEGNVHQGIKGNGAGFIDTVDDSTKEAVLCCADKNLGEDWLKNDNCDVWVNSHVNGFCHKEKTWKEANEICNNAGARLCSSVELENGCGKNAWKNAVTKSGNCNVDSLTVKTDTCADETFMKKYSGHYIGCGSKGGCADFPEEKEASKDQTLAAVRCCNDEDHAHWTSSCDTIDNVYENTLLSDNGCKTLTWPEANDRCVGHGQDARLCTIEELNDDCAQSRDCDFDSAKTWSKSPVFLDNVGDIPTTFSSKINTTLVENIIPTFLQEALFCAKDLFFSNDRKKDDKFKNEKFVFGDFTKKEDGDNIMDYRIPTGLLTDDNSTRTVHGQVINNGDPPFTFKTVKHLVYDFNQCLLEAEETMVQKVKDEYGDKYWAKDFELISFVETGLEEYKEDVNDKCIKKFFAAITLGLKLVFGDKPSPGFICGINEAVVEDDMSLPGSCCLDAPFELNDNNWGYDYDCSQKCSSPASYFTGISEQACSAQGGKWCPSKADCTVLRNCVSAQKKEAKETKQYAYEDYLNNSPEITDQHDLIQCGKAREYFGYDKYFINDDKVCEDIEQLAYTRDFDFLNEFFGQGSEGGGGAFGDDDVTNPVVPAMKLKPVDTESSESKSVQDGRDWADTNFALTEVIDVMLFVMNMVQNAKCPCDIFCIATTICDLVQWVVTYLSITICFVVEKILAISEFTMGEKAETDNIQPMEIWENFAVVHGNMEATGKWLQKRFQELGEYLDDKYKEQETILDNALREKKRRLSEESAIPLLSAPGEETTRELCNNLDFHVETINVSPRIVACHLKCDGAATKPDALEVKMIDTKTKEAVVIQGDDTIIIDEVRDGFFTVEIPHGIDANMFLMKVIVKGSTSGNTAEMMERTTLVSFPTAKSWVSSLSDFFDFF